MKSTAYSLLHETAQYFRRFMKPARTALVYCARKETVMILNKSGVLIGPNSEVNIHSLA